MSNIHFFIRPLKVFFVRILLYLGILKKYILVRMDGGICSQMHFFLIGNYFEKKGYKVKYSLEWFEQNGHDMRGMDVRKFDLLKAFPYIHVDTVGRLESFLYGVFSYNNDYFDRTSLYDWLELSPPIYLKGYYNTPLEWYSNFKNYFKVDFNLLNEANKLLLNEIKHKDNSVAVHVRRGDLSIFNPAYGEPVNASYFLNAMHYIEQYKDDLFYYFFSDDPNWVARQLIPELALIDNYRIVDINGSDKGYFDLFLISACKNHITSKGSLGKYGAFLSDESDSVITIADDIYERNVWEGADKRIVFIEQQ